jgi:hypothetical protein
MPNNVSRTRLESVILLDMIFTLVCVVSALARQATRV